MLKKTATRSVHPAHCAYFLFLKEQIKGIIITPCHLLATPNKVNVIARVPRPSACSCRGRRQTRIHSGGLGSTVPSGEPLIRVRGKSSPCRLSSYSAKCVCGEADRSVVMRSPCAGTALDPPLWIVPNKALSLSLSLSLCTVCQCSAAAPSEVCPQTQGLSACKPQLRVTAVLAVCRAAVHRGNTDGTCHHVCPCRHRRWQLLSS